MPIGFWNDPDGAKYRAAYFERFPGVWCHGDYVELTEHGGHDHLRPLRRHAEPRRRAHRHRGDLPPGRAARRGAGEPRHRPGLAARARSATCASCCSSACATASTLDAALAERIRQHIRVNTTPRHVPAKVVQVTDIPRTKSGKIVELAVRNVVHGMAGEEHRGAGQSRSARAIPRPRRAEDVSGPAGRGAPPRSASPCSSTPRVPCCSSSTCRTRSCRPIADHERVTADCDWLVRAAQRIGVPVAATEQ